MSAGVVFVLNKQPKTDASKDMSLTGIIHLSRSNLHCSAS